MARNSIGTHVLSAGIGREPPAGEGDEAPVSEPLTEAPVELPRAVPPNAAQVPKPLD